MKNVRKLLFAIVILSMTVGMLSCSMMNGADFGGSADVGAGGGSYGDGYYGGSSSDKGESSGGDYVPGAPEGGVSGDDDGFMPDAAPDVDGDISDEGGEMEGDDDIEEKPDGDTNNVMLPSGMITAGAWNDNDNYNDWLALFEQGENGNGKFFNYTYSSNSWGYNSLKRVKVTVSCNEGPVSGAEVIANNSSGQPLFKAVTDASGNAYLFTDEENGSIFVTSGEGSATAEFDKDNRELSVMLDNSADKLDVIEIMLVVDVTGSMGDELYFLKAELSDMINKIIADNPGCRIKLALLFYRDTDDRVPFDYYDFADISSADSPALEVQQKALNSQNATGGGDYPEAVDEALYMAVNKQWSTGSTTKIIFHVLDAPAHSGSKYAEKLVNATNIAAEKGIRICPIICSGAAEETEYTMREAAIYTGGTFIFVTDDSGIGGSHHDPGLPNVTIELLNSLMVRLVNGYHTGNFNDPIYWKEDPNLNNK